MVATLANCFGSRNGEMSDVPADRKAGLAHALKRLGGGDAVSLAMANAVASGSEAKIRAAMEAAPRDGEAVFAGIRAKAYGEKAEDDGRPTSLAALHEQAFLRWNRTRQKTD